MATTTTAQSEVSNSLPSYHNTRFADLVSRRSSLRSSVFGLDNDHASRSSTRNHSRGASVASVYTISRNSFASQLARLTSVSLPDPTRFGSSEELDSTAAAALSILEDAAFDIQRWLRNAARVLKDLYADDDIAWAAAAGQDGVEQVDEAMKHFAIIIQSYMACVERLQSREDVGHITQVDMCRLLDQIEDIATKWEDWQSRLQAVKQQVELSLEWEELQCGVLEDITGELEKLAKVVFEMEERRHIAADYGFIAPSPTKTEDGTTDTFSQRRNMVNERPGSPIPVVFAETPLTHEGSTLISLVARMQPLRASLDFLPMRLATFQQRADEVFPTACKELKSRQVQLEDSWRELELDARALRKELGDDRWVGVFRNAAQQAIRMIESVNRSLAQVGEALEGSAVEDYASLTDKKIDSYKAKKAHYCPAIERVLEILAKGAKERTSVNGEVVRLQTDARQRWQTLRTTISSLDTALLQYEERRANRPSRQESLSSVGSWVHSQSHDHNMSSVTPTQSPAATSYLLPSARPRDRGSLLLGSPGQIRSRSRDTVAHLRDTTAARPSLRTKLSSIDIRDALSRPRSRDPRTPQYTPRTSLLPIRLNEERRSSSPTLGKYSSYATPERHFSISTPIRSSYLPTPNSTAVRPQRPRWNSSTKVVPRKAAGLSKNTVRLQKDSVLDLSAAYDSLSQPQPMQTPLRTRPSKLSEPHSQTLLTPQSASRGPSRDPSRSHTSLGAEYLCSATTSGVSISTPLRSRASMGMGRLSSAYTPGAAMTPRSPDSIGLRQGHGGNTVTPQSTARPRWRS